MQEIEGVLEAVAATGSSGSRGSSGGPPLPAVRDSEVRDNRSRSVTNPAVAGRPQASSPDRRSTHEK
eukprot:7739408-Karenia_brevis.AAC.1